MTEISEKPSELFTREFRHEVVNKFIKEVAEGAIRIITPMKFDDYEYRKILSNFYSKFTSSVEDYLSEKIKGDTLVNLEAVIFADIITLRTAGLIEEDKYSIPEVKQKVSSLEAKIESTNNLLSDVLSILMELLRRLDKK
ncbi:MAG: hypothetical protein ACREBI_08530 [Nitrosotalea sp.]